MRIGYVIKMYPRFSETFILNEILELERQGVEVRIFSLVKPNDGRFHASLSKVQARVTYLPEYPLHEAKEISLPACINLIGRDPSKFLKILWYALTHRNGAGLKQFLRASVLADRLFAEPVEQLHAHFASSSASVAMLASLFTGIPFSFTAHAKDIYLKSIDRNLLHDKLALANFVVTVSDFNRNYLSGLIQDSKLPPVLNWRRRDNPDTNYPASIRRLYNGIDLLTFRPRPGLVGEDQKTPLILSVGRLVEKKGFEDLIHACGILHDQGLNFRCEIIGKGPLEPVLKELIARLGLNKTIFLAGPKPQDEIVSIYSRATVFALPCVIGDDGNRDGLPTVLLEAMATGIPVVSTYVTGIPEIIDNGSTGILIPEHDPIALAEAVGRLIQDEGLSKQMSRMAIEKVNREFDLRTNVAVLHQWFENSIGKEVSPETPHSNEILSSPIL